MVAMPVLRQLRSHRQNGLFVHASVPDGSLAPLEDCIQHLFGVKYVRVTAFKQLGAFVYRVTRDVWF